MFELIVSEKPQAAAKIASALGDSTPKKIRESNVNYFSITHKGKQIRVASAVGHLYGLGEKGGESWQYPVFETEWKEAYKANKQAKYTKDYINVLKKLGKDANEVTVASDYDIEGEVIGLNVVRFACKKKDANRMKFSTLTKGDLVKAYENKQPHLEWGQAKAGETRHTLDWIYGINLSRAFTSSIKRATRSFKVLSTGRVQAPTLHFLAMRERKIQAFVPETFWEIHLKGNCSKVDIKAQYELPLDVAKKHQITEEDEEGEEKKVVDRYKIFDEEWKEKVVDDCKGQDGVISDITSKQFKQNVPTPFDLTSLQMEASNHLGISPKRTLEIAQKLYIEGVTSYPRTSSQKLPKELDLKDKLDKLSKQPIFREKVELVRKINSSLKPNEGKKEDPAHPAIHPTGEVPKKLEGQEARVYDLIVKRFLAVFGKPATRETNTIVVDVNFHNFILKGTRTVDPGWHLLYEPYLKFEDVELPKLDKGSVVANKGLDSPKKETSPPKRYSDASIIKELEKRNLGTKATRAEILNNLRERGYIIDKSIKVTELGLKMDEVLDSEIPLLTGEELTRHFEEEMEKIREEKSRPEDVLLEAQEKLEKILVDIKSREVEFGLKLADASKLARKQLTTIAPCPSCENGNLVIKTSPKTRKSFVACDKYPECKTIFNVPPGVIRPVDSDPVDENGFIYIMAGRNENSLKKVCINPKKVEESSEKKYDEEGMECPTCSKGKMKLRKSFYGEFLGCDNYPACKTMMKIIKGEVDTNPIVMGDKKKAPNKKKKEKN